MYRRFSTRQWLIVALLCLGPLLSACGQKGDLYLPDEPVQAPQKKQPADDQEEKNS